MPEVNRRQAMVPRGAIVLDNPLGTAPQRTAVAIWSGLWALLSRVFFGQAQYAVQLRIADADGGRDDHAHHFGTT